MTRFRSSGFGGFLLLAACATGSEGPVDGPGNDGGGGASSGDGDGGTTAVGYGGAPSGSTANGSTTSQGTSTSTSTTTSSTSSGTGGGPVDDTLDTVFMIAGGGSATVVSNYDVVANTGFSWPWQNMTADPIGLSRAPLGTTHAFVRQYPDGELLHSQWTGTNWLLLAEVQTGLTIEGGPSSVGEGSDVHVAYHFGDGSYGYSRVGTAGFDPASEVVGNPASLGASAPAIAAIPTGAVVAFVSDDGDLIDRTRMGPSTWTAEHAHALLEPLAPITPALIAPETGPELLVVAVRASDNALVYRTRSGGTWGMASVLAGAFSNAPPQLVQLASGEVALTYLAQDGGGFTVSFDGTSFAQPVLLAPSLLCAPAMTTGADGAEAEAVIIDSIGGAYWSRRVAGQWSAGTFAAVASPPSCLALVAAP